MQFDEKFGDLSEALPYLQRFVGKTVVIKIGGNALSQEESSLQDIVWLHRLGILPVVVHGGGRTVSEWLERLGLEVRFEEGLRVTDEATMEIVQTVLAGKVNKEVVMRINKLGGNGFGLSGLDGGLIQARPIRAELGLAGEVTGINLQPMRALLDNGFIPVVAPMGVDEDGQVLNTNADAVAGELAVSLKAEKLVMMTDVIGICSPEGELYSQMSAGEALRKIEAGIITGGMIPKVKACLRGLQVIPRAHIVDGRQPHALMQELFTNKGVGTMITRD